ncbi:hypothetical protein F2Q70_00045113 [Brassica cretica]|uniref:Protein kinase domain-containing protein n=1 Tax=Brassica cretica TaxID=69181 RepID=A0A8S9KKU0_BRACR|nr:hypothetical protein F2Q70_00045113 [Brassica cretica]
MESQHQIHHGVAPPDSKLEKEVMPFTKFSFSDLEKATQNFAIKKFSTNAWPDPEKFEEEAKRVGELKHKRFVSLIGCCADGDERLLVAEFLPNDTLAKRLFHDNNNTLEWSMRLKVACGIAEALDYCSTKGFTTSFSNLSANSILFDDGDNACLSCFGLMKESEDGQTTSFDQFTSVAYKFGCVLLNLLTGKEYLDGEYVVKKATEYGAVEIWMNERVRRACGNSCADFVYGFLEKPSKKGPEYWLLWKYEGESTLAGLLQSKDFPYNVETIILGKVQDLPKGLERENIIIQTIMRQLLFALDGLHSTGIVHRDVKPQNIIFSEGSRAFKIIDLGAAADLRVGINYIPKEFLLDPRYAAPEQYIMSTQTPSAPSAPVAAALSPVLWQMNLPDRFDIYSIGLIFLQMD